MPVAMSARQLKLEKKIKIYNAETGNLSLRKNRRKEAIIPCILFCLRFPTVPR